MWRWLAVGAAVCMAACTRAQAEDAKPVRAPMDPTSDAHRYDVWRRETVLNQTKAYNDASFWHGVELLTLNYVPPKPPVVPVPTARSQRTSANTASGGSTGACGGSKYDYVIADESGGNPNAHNPSGATGCYQIMPGTWSGACSDLGSQQGASTATQAECADRVGDSNPRAWAASGH